MQETANRTKTVIWILAGIAAVLAVIVGIKYLYVNRLSAVWSMAGEPEMTAEYGEAFEEPGVSAILYGPGRNSKGRELRVEALGEVDPLTLGEQTVRYRASAFLFSAETERLVTVRDTVPPVITLAGTTVRELRIGEEYEEDGFTATDNCDGDITASVIRIPEEGGVRYEVEDASGNRASVFRALRYENQPPRIELLGGDMELPAGIMPFTDPGFICSDDHDGDLTGQVTVTENTVNPYHAGEYEIVYSCTDSEGLTGTATRRVTVTSVGAPEEIYPTAPTIYLTFDDGPSYNTERLLDTLDYYGVQATFFVTGVHSDYSPMLGEIVRRGHTIAMHSACHHYNEIYVSEEAYFADLREIQDLIFEYAGVRPTLVRFPGGGSNTVSCYNPGIMTRLAGDLADMGYTYFDWNVSGADTADNATYASVVANVCEDAGKREVSVVLQHDTCGFSVDAVAEIIEWGLANGYAFRALDASSPTMHHPIVN